MWQVGYGRTPVVTLEIDIHILEGTPAEKVALVEEIKSDPSSAAGPKILDVKEHEMLVIHWRAGYIQD